MDATATGQPQRIKLTLAPPHAAQCKVIRGCSRYNAVDCGRRWGKTRFGVEYLAAKVLIGGGRVGWFAPTYKLLEEAWGRCLDVFRPLRPDSNKAERWIQLPTGGRIEFWSLERTVPGRSFMAAQRPSCSAGCGGSWHPSWQTWSGVIM